MSDLYLNCNNQYEDLDSLFRSTIVDSDGNPYITCDNQYESWMDLFRQMIVEDSEGNPAIAMAYDRLATRWEDLRVPISAVKVGSLKPPGFEAWINFLYLYWFDPDDDEQVYFVCQIPHAYIQNTDFHPHVHFVPKSNGAAGQKVVWGLEYAFAEIGSTFAGSTAVYGQNHFPADTSLVANRHYLTELTPISGVGVDSVSSMFVCRLWRFGTNGDDTYTDDVGLLEFDFHIQVNDIGSDTEYIK